MYFTANAFSAMPAALAVAAAALGARVGGDFAPWLVGVSAAVAVAELAATLSLAGHGAFGPAGAATTTAIFGTLTLWTAVVSVRALTMRS